MSETVYRETREQSGVTVHCASAVRSWAGWPDDARDVLRRWNDERRLSFVGMDPIGAIPPQPSFKCPDCGRFCNSSGSTACRFDGVLICDDCMIAAARSALARAHGPPG